MLKVIGIDKNEEWDRIVKTFSDYDVYYLSGYVKAFQIHGDGEPLLFFYESSQVRGINVVMKRDIALNPNFSNDLPKGMFFDFATPYGYGGWLIEGGNTEELFEEYEKWCLEHHIVSEFVRYHPVLNNQSMSSGFYDVLPLGETVCLDLHTKETIWNNFNSKNRNVIRKAINNGITIKCGLSQELFDSFVEIYNGTMNKDNASDYYYFEKDFYKSILNDLKDNASIFYADLDGNIIASSIMIFANGHLNYHLSGSLRDYQHLAPSNLLLWKAAEWGNDNGYTTFHLGGGVGSEEDGLFKFKKAFYRGELCRYHIGKRIFDKETYDKLVKMRGIEPKNNYFPKYRA